MIAVSLSLGYAAPPVAGTSRAQHATATSSGAASAADPRTLFFNASIVHTMAAPAAAWCVAGGRFVATGTLTQAQTACGASAHRVDLAGAIVVPGFIDSHLHLLYGGFMLVRPQLDNASSPADVVASLQSWLKAHPLPPNAWIQGFGWDQNRFTPPILPTRADLDGAFPTTPVWLTRIDGHAAWANSAALRAAPPLPTSDPKGGRIVRDNATGEPTGVFTDAAMPLVSRSVPPPTFGQKAEALDKALKLCAQNGVTSIHDPGIDVGDRALYMGAVDNGTFTLRQHAMWLGTDTDGLGPHGAASPTTPKIHRYKDRFSAEAVKFFLDGALGSWGAAMLQNYSDRPHEHGQMRMSAAQFRANVTAWAQAGYQVATHAIGDAANRLALDVYSSICDAAAEADESCDAAPDLRLRIEHFQIVNESDVSRVTYPGTNASRACILASMQPTHATSDMEFAESRLGPERLKGAYAWQSVVDSGAAALPFGSDWPTVGQVPPLLGLYAAVTREDLHGHPAGGWTPTEKVSRAQALRGYTTDAAFAAFAEGEVGRIADGYYADFVALDRDVLDADAVPAADIWRAAILGTWSGGRRVWSHPCAGAVGLGALRACVERARAAAPPSEDALARLRRLADAHGDGCPF